jgi:diacylglycerol kinase (ATP)
MSLTKKLWCSTRWSLSGLKYAVTHEMSFRLEIMLAIALTPLAFLLAIDLNQLLLLIFSLYAVLIVELINTAIEATVDRFGPERNELSKHAKDAGSAAVFLSILLAAIVWGSIIWSYILKVY